MLRVLNLISNNLCLFPDAFQYSESNGTNGHEEMEMVFLKGILDNPAVTQKFKVSFDSQYTKHFRWEEMYKKVGAFEPLPY